MAWISIDANLDAYKVLSLNMISFQTYLVAIGQSIQKQRIAKKLTQYQLITIVHQLCDEDSGSRQLAQETLSRIENGRFNPSLKQLFLISHALGTSISELHLSAQQLINEKLNE